MYLERYMLYLFSCKNKGIGNCCTNAFYKETILRMLAAAGFTDVGI